MFFEKLIFGKPLPPYAEKYPSQFSPTHCTKPHCTPNCTSIWSLILSEKHISHSSLVNVNIPDELRISVYYKLVNRPTAQIKFKDGKCDRNIVRVILGFYRDRNVDAMVGKMENERMMFDVYKSLVDEFYTSERVVVKSLDGSVNIALKHQSNEIIEEGNNEKILQQNTNNPESKTTQNRTNNNDTNNNNENYNDENNIDTNYNDENNENYSKDNNENYAFKTIEDANAVDNNDDSKMKYNRTDTTSNILDIDDDAYVDIDLIILIDYLLNQYHSTENITFNILYVLFERMYFDKIYFTSTINNNLLRINAELFTKIQKQTHFLFVKMFISKCIRKKINRIFDIIFVFGGSVFYDILKYMLEKIKIEEIVLDDNEEQVGNVRDHAKLKCINQRITDMMINYLISNLDENIAKMVKTLSIKDSTSIPVKCEQSEEYFDFMVVLNQIAVNEECLKKEMADKLSILEKTNIDLLQKNENLKTNLENMEKERSDFMDKYVKNIKEMLDVESKRADKLEKENEKMKKKLAETK